MNWLWLYECLSSHPSYIQKSVNLGNSLLNLKKRRSVQERNKKIDDLLFTRVVNLSEPFDNGCNDAMFIQFMHGKQLSYIAVIDEFVRQSQ